MCKTKIYLVDKEQAPQSQIRIGYVTDMSYDATGDYFKSYRFAMSNIGCTGDMSTGVTPNRYIKDCFALAFDLTPDSCLNNHLHNSIDANIDIKLRFGKALDTPLTVLYISTYDNVIKLSPDKSVALDYTV